MRIPRIHVQGPLRSGAEIPLPESSGEHLVRVLRLQRGHPLILFNGDGCEYPAELSQIAKRGVCARVTDAGKAVDRESPLHLTLAQGIARGEKMDLILQKATELGVHAIVPLQTARTEVKLDAERSPRRMAHWQGVIASAAEQSGRCRLPELDQPRRLAEWAAALPADAGLRLCLDPAADTKPQDLPRFDRALLVVGPEGGLAQQDLTLLGNAGFQGVRLGPRVLRTETAGLAAIAALQVLHGDF